jgi:hypothetical protein
MFRSDGYSVLILRLHVAIGRLHVTIVYRSCFNRCEHVASLFLTCCISNAIARMSDDALPTNRPQSLRVKKTVCNLISAPPRLALRYPVHGRRPPLRPSIRLPSSWTSDNACRRAPSSLTLPSRLVVGRRSSPPPFPLSPPVAVEVRFTALGDSPCPGVW